MSGSFKVAGMSGSARRSNYRLSGQSTRHRPPQREVDPKAALVCARKQRHPDELTARAAAVCAIELNQNTSELYVYRCEACLGWHLTRFKVGAPATAGDPVAESDWRAPLLEIARGGKVQTYRNCEYGDRREQMWLHYACLKLEQEGKLRRHFEREHAITWVST